MLLKETYENILLFPLDLIFSSSIGLIISPIWFKIKNPKIYYEKF